MKLPRRGMALPLTLFFVMVAFFAATAVVTRSHYEARASVLESASIQQEALARSALVTLQGKLDQAGTDEDAPTVTLEGPGGYKATTWIERENDEVLRLCAKVEGGVGQPYIAQKIVQKKPVLTALDLAHLTDGDMATADHIRLRLADADTWQNLPAPKSSLLWVNVDRRGNIFANHFPVLAGEDNSTLPADFVQELVKKNDEYLRQGRINFKFMRQAAAAIEENTELNLNNFYAGTQGGGFAGGVGGFAGNAGNAGNAVPANGIFQGNPIPQLQESLIRPTHDVASAFAKNANIQFYSPETGEWEKISVALPSGPHVPGRTCSDGKNLYLPILQPGPDELKSYDLKSKKWSEIPAPPAVKRNSSGLLVTDKGKSTKVLALEVNDNGDLFCHHGDGEDFTVSRFDQSKKKWTVLPPPPGLYSNSNGQKQSVMTEAKVWGNLAVDGEGDVFVVWRPSEEEEVRSYQREHGPLEDFSTGFSGFGPSGGISTPVGEGASLGIMPMPPPQDSSNNGSNQQNPTRNPGTFVGNPDVYAFSPVQDVLLTHRNDTWSAVTPSGEGFLRIGSVSTSVEGRLVIQNIQPFGPDELMTLDTDGQLGKPTTVPGIDDTAAEFFSFDSGGKPVEGRYRFQETAEY